FGRTSARRPQSPGRKERRRTRRPPPQSPSPSCPGDLEEVQPGGLGCESGLHVGPSRERIACGGVRLLIWGRLFPSAGTKLSVRSPFGGFTDGALREVISQKR